MEDSALHEKSLILFCTIRGGGFFISPLWPSRYAFHLQIVKRRTFDAVLFAFAPFARSFRAPLQCGTKPAPAREFSFPHAFAVLLLHLAMLMQPAGSF